MDVASSKEKILKNIREALSHPVPLPFPKSEGTNSVFIPPHDDLEIIFAEEFTKLLGKFAFCVNETDMKLQLMKLAHENKWENLFCEDEALLEKFSGKGLFDKKVELSTCDAAATSCDCLVARTGAIVMSSANAAGRTVSAYTPIHICIAYTDQLVFDTRDAIKLLKEKYATIPSFITFAAGPSRTADIEKTLIVGVHGPKEVYLFLIDRQPRIVR
ncbi:lactate utilization protein [soil metagenome]